MKLVEATRQAAAEAAAEATVKSVDFARKVNERSAKTKAAFFATFMVGYYAIFAKTAFGAGEGCDSEAADKIVDFLSSIGKFLLIIVGALSALVFLAGGAMVVVGANNENRVRSGMKMMKNALIGLVAVVAAGVVRWLILDLLAGSTGVDTDRCIEKSSDGMGVGDIR